MIKEDREKVNDDKMSVLNTVKKHLTANNFVLAAQAYGSSLHEEKSVDIDIAVTIPSNCGIVDSEIYRSLYKLRSTLSNITGCDIDLVPHTADEFEDIDSPLWNPRYNPSLVFGQTIKGEFHIEPIFNKKEARFKFEDFARYLLHDNRTICRRQLVRSLEGEFGRIFVSKLIHGPGNALTYYACKNSVNYLHSPSDLTPCFRVFDKTYKVDSTPALQFFNSIKNVINFEKGLKLMSWYEHLVALIFYGNLFAQLYNDVCHTLENE